MKFFTLSIRLDRVARSSRKIVRQGVEVEHRPSGCWGQLICLRYGNAVPGACRIELGRVNNQAGLAIVALGVGGRGNDVQFDLTVALIMGAQTDGDLQDVESLQ